ncbi:DsbA family protein [Vibrio parahaemolyticus]
MSISKPRLYYVYDPMCSWCWGFRPTWQAVKIQLEDQVDIHYILGGLAPDSDVPMPLEMQQQIASYWRKIADYLGTEFNHDFWSQNTPRRSTYPACRAIIAARNQGAEQDMYHAIQRAYYLEAKNPSDDAVLVDVAQSIGLDGVQFETDLLSEATNECLYNEIAFARSIGGNSFPSLILQTQDQLIDIPVDYKDPNKLANLIMAEV